jgi:hypothetical protein
MRGGTVLVLLGITAFGAYSVSRQSAPVSNAPVPAFTSPSALAQRVAFIGPAAQAASLVPAPSASGGPTPSTKAGLPDKPAGIDTKRKVEAGLTSSSAKCSTRARRSARSVYFHQATIALLQSCAGPIAICSN